MNPLLLNQKQAASALGISRWTLRRLEARGKVRPVTLMRRKMFKAEQIERLSK